jgi:FOG: TPR repeat, SEL1 subfamily
MNKIKNSSVSILACIGNTMKKLVSFGLLILCSFSSYANQCEIYWLMGSNEEAFTPCKVEAEQGNAEAQYNLARKYEKGDGIEQVMYEKGDGVEQDKII